MHGNLMKHRATKKPEHARNNARAVGWRLSYEDWRRIDELSKSIKITYVTW